MNARRSRTPSTSTTRWCSRGRWPTSTAGTRRHNTFPSSELAPLRRQWPVLPTFVYGGINYGRIEVPTRSRSAASNGA
jgi:hypothetical protein